MPDQLGGVLQLVLSAVATGTVAAAGLTILTNWLMKRREEYIDISKYKIDSISKSKPYYIQSGRYSGLVASQLSYAIEHRRNTIDLTLCLYYISITLLIHQKILEEFGEIQLDNLDAETIISGYSRKAIQIINKALGPIDLFRLISLVRKDAHSAQKGNDVLYYHEFLTKLQESSNDHIKQKFEHWFLYGLTVSNEELKELENALRYYSQLLQLELSHVYKIWYKREPRFKHLSRDLKDNLERDNSSYYCRIKCFDYGRIKKLFSQRCWRFS